MTRTQDVIVIGLGVGGEAVAGTVSKTASSARGWIHGPGVRGIENALNDLSQQ
ncbi:MAG: hypothetical protein M3N53_08930 [Actinomycetota bacterium]|nr:hypothetical protein [Actinomycetota bacterium]